MAAITIEVPDDLLAQLAQLGESSEVTLREHLPELLRPGILLGFGNTTVPTKLA